ncbi:MAG TPA: methylated-DNA--[protein]-cysteine S-methyltransferase [Thermoplasmata archaeon]|nr:methylated-DNA--[protein]-cysteine S-methyltransferase [Thermoplasmata archaeon]
MAHVEFADVPTPIGSFRVVYEGRAVHSVDLLERGLDQVGVPVGARQRRPPFSAGSPPRELGEYFRGKRSSFDLVLDPSLGTEFDRQVWTILSRVPAGSTVTYADLARRAGHPGAARAVGGAMRRNPIPIIVPCHRVVGSAGDLTGFGLGLWRKRWLLDHEGAWPLKTRSVEGPRGRSQRTLDFLLEPTVSGRRARVARAADSLPAPVLTP